MSKMSFSSPARAQTKPLPDSAQPILAVRFWFWLGVILLSGEAYFIVKWVTGPAFVRVPSGADLPPEWMRMVMDYGQVVMLGILLFAIFWFVVRPWRRERRITTDGLLTIGCASASIWDPITNGVQYWFTYNSYLLNWGSVVTVLPWNLAPHSPDVNEAWSPFILMPVYGTFAWVTMVLCTLMRGVKARWPRINTPALIATCFVAAIPIDFLIEGLIFQPLGFWVFAGGHWNINAGTYYQFPMSEGICAGFIFTTLTSLRYFVNDKGQTWVERGLDQVKGSPASKSLMRSVAVISAVHVAFFVTFHLPQVFFALHSTAWPDDIVNRSYFTHGICGPRVNLACPGPQTPIARPGAPRPDFSGKYQQQ